ncbi:MAG: ABC transporter ATP-binding protein [Nitrospirota bacterium]
MDRSIIKTGQLVKEYHIFDHPFERLKELFFRKKEHKVFRALGPLDLEIHKGETLGVIGENGAGKSTFLKLVAGVIEPSSGSISVDGKVSSILELGTGFNPEFTGRENVLLNGTLHGLSEGQIAARMDRMEKFADIGEFFDMPVKTYSSGMYMRLAFSLAVHVDADIIVIDEALAVGDGAYEKKCIDRIWELKRKGVTLLYCSHSLYTVASFCDRALWLRQGRAESIGRTTEVISLYENYLREKENREKEEAPPSIDAVEPKVAMVKNIMLRSAGYPVQLSLKSSSDLEVQMSFEILEDVEIWLGFAIDRNDGLCCFADSMVRQGMPPFRGQGEKTASVIFRNLPLLGGAYKVVVFLLDNTGICIFDRKESPSFIIETDEKEWGVCRLPYEWKR